MTWFLSSRHPNPYQDGASGNRRSFPSRKTDVLEGNEPTIQIPWPWLAGILVGAAGGLVAAIRYLFNKLIEAHNKEIEGRDKRREEDSVVWKEALNSLVASQKEATNNLASSYRESIASLGGQIGEAVSRQIKESGKQQEDLIRQILQPKARTIRRSK